MWRRETWFLYWNSNFHKFCWVIRTQPISVLKLFLVYLGFITLAMQFQIGKVFSSFFPHNRFVWKFPVSSSVHPDRKRFQVELGEDPEQKFFFFSCACLHCNLTILRNSFYFLYRSETDTSFSFHLHKG